MVFFKSSFSFTAPVSPVTLTSTANETMRRDCHIIITCATAVNVSIQAGYTCPTNGNASCVFNGPKDQQRATSQGILRVYQNDFVSVCNHSNQVSHSVATVKLDHRCSDISGK